MSTESSNPDGTTNNAEGHTVILAENLNGMASEMVSQPSPAAALSPLTYEDKLVNRMLAYVNTEYALDYKNINMDGSGFPHSLPAKSSFKNNKSRTAIQVGGVAEEVILSQSLAEICKAIGSNFGFISTEGASKSVKASENDLNQRYYVVMDTSDERLRVAMATVGYKVEITLQLDYPASDFTPLKLKHDQILPAAFYLASACTHGPKHYSDSDLNSDPDKRPFTDWLPIGNLSLHEKKVDDSDSDSQVLAMERTEAYIEVLQNRRQNLAKVITQFNSSADFPDSFPNRDAWAMETACQLVPKLEKKEKAAQRISSWLSENNWFKFSPACVDWTKVQWHGRRIKPPRGVRSTQAFFKVETPAQPYWPPFLSARLAKVKLPMAEDCDTLQKTVDRMETSIHGTLSYEPDLKVQWFEGEVHKKLHMALSESSPMAWWRYILDFKHLDPKHYWNLHSEFPGIAKHLKLGHFTGEHEEAARGLMHAKAGKFIVSGCPGSGKSTFCQKIASAVLEQNWQPDAGDSGSTTDVDDQKPVQIIYTSPQNEQCRDAIRRFKQMNPSKNVCRLYGYHREMFALLCGDDDAEPELEPEQNGTINIKVSHSPAKPFNKTVIQHDDARDPFRDPDSLSSIAQAIASKEDLSTIQRSRNLWKEDKQNWQRSKLAYRQVARSLLKRAIREQHAFFGTAVAVAQCYDHLEKEDGVLGSPALLIVDEVGRLTETHALIGVSLWKSVPTIFAGDHEQFGPIVPTSKVRLEYTVGDRDWKFISRLSAQREVSFLSRAAASGGIDATFTHNYRVYGSVGDLPCKHLYQGKMIQVNTEENIATKAVGQWFRDFGGSKINSLFVNLESEELQQGTSKVNYGSAYFAVQLAVHIGREMKLPLMEDYKRHEKPLEMKQSIRKGRIQILVGYAAQVPKVQYFLRKVSDLEVDKSRITVRSIDDAPSHEAEIVIVDLVRTKSAGFLAEPARLKVAATRAKLGTIWVGNAAICCWRRAVPLWTLYRYHAERGALIRVKGYMKTCYKCHHAGHDQKRCPEDYIICIICKSDSEIDCDDGSSIRHAIRECQVARKSYRARWDEERWLTPPQSVDNVDRNPFHTWGPRRI